MSDEQALIRSLEEFCAPPGKNFKTIRIWASANKLGNIDPLVYRCVDELGVLKRERGDYEQVRFVTTTPEERALTKMSIEKAAKKIEEDNPGVTATPVSASAVVVKSAEPTTVTIKEDAMGRRPDTEVYVPTAEAASILGVHVTWFVEEKNKKLFTADERRKAAEGHGFEYNLARVKQVRDQRALENKKPRKKAELKPALPKAPKKSAETDLLDPPHEEPLESPVSTPKPKKERKQKVDVSHIDQLKQALSAGEQNVEDRRDVILRRIMWAIQGAEEGMFSDAETLDKIRLALELPARNVAGLLQS